MYSPENWSLQTSVYNGRVDEANHKASPQEITAVKLFSEELA